jgi:hypothetical protein
MPADSAPVYAKASAAGGWTSVVAMIDGIRILP